MVILDGPLNVDELVHDFYIEIAKSKGDILRYLVDLESNVEGWFRVEFAYYLHRRGLHEFRERTVNGGKRIDVGFETIERIVRPYDKTVYFELKHIIPQQDSAERPIRSWFNSYIASDMIKLHNIRDFEAETSPEFNEKYQLTFVSAKTEDKGLDERVKPALSDFQNGRGKDIRCNLVRCEFRPECDFGYFLLKVSS